MADEFDPTIHGFYFPNAFDNPITTIDFFGHKLDLQTGGRCGGMSYLALDYFFKKIHLPSCAPGDFTPATLRNPQDTSFLADACMKRLLKSWSDCFGKWLSFFAPLLVSGYLNDQRDALADDFVAVAKLAGLDIPTPLNLAVARGYTPTGGAVACNLGEMQTVRSVVSKTSPRPLGMVSKTDLSAVADAHYVVAFDKQDLPGDKFQIKVWDCNFPGETMLLTMDAKNPTKLEETHASGAGGVAETWEGFFVDEQHHELFPQKLSTDSDLAYVDVVADVVVPDTVKTGAALTVKVSLSNPSQFAAHLKELRVVGEGKEGVIALPSVALANNSADFANLTGTIPAFASSSGLKFISVRAVMKNAGGPGFPLPTTGRKKNNAIENAVVPVSVVD